MVHWELIKSMNLRVECIVVEKTWV